MKELLFIEFTKLTGWSYLRVFQELKDIDTNYWDLLLIYFILNRMLDKNEVLELNKKGLESFLDKFMEDLSLEKLLDTLKYHREINDKINKIQKSNSAEENKAEFLSAFKHSLINSKN